MHVDLGGSMGDSSARPRILVVDDDAQQRELFRAWLEPAHEIVEAADGPAAIAAVERGGIDLVLLSVWLPGMSGVETCRAIRSTHPDAELPVLLVSAHARQASRNEGLAAGADDFISIPCDRTELTLRVGVFLRTRRQDALIREQLADLTRISALKDDLIALVAHDLRGPLGSILTLVGLAREDVADPEIRKDLDVAYSAAERAREIAEDLLQVRLLEHGEHVLHRLAADAGEVVREAIRTVEPAARGRKVAIHVEVHGDPLYPLDGPLVRRAVENLVASAVKHSPEGAPVSVAIRRTGEELAIDVSDRGPPIPAAAREAVFRTFAPAERSALARRTYGLGLYLVRLVAEAHGGDATVEDAAGGGGALFRLRLAAPGGARAGAAEGAA
jgi:signal transduction histidine kinase